MKKLLLALFVLWPFSALAGDFGYVVATCGTLPAPYTAGGWGLGANAGLNGPLSVDVNGVLCSSTGGGGGGGGPATLAAGSVASGAYVSGALADGSIVTLGAKADAKSTATDTTSITIMSVLKEISAMEQAPASRAVTNAGTFAVQATGTFFQATQPVSIASGQVASGAVASGAYASGAISDGADVTQGAKGDATCGTATGTCTLVQLLKYLNANGIITTGTAGAPSATVLSTQGAAAMTPLLTSQTAAITPTFETGNSTGTTGAVVGTLATAVGKTTYICGFDVSAIGGTATVGPITVAGLITSSMVFQLGSLAAGNTLPVTFNPCIPASATNTTITITTTADGTASAVDVNSWGYQQ